MIRSTPEESRVWLISFLPWPAESNAALMANVPPKLGGVDLFGRLCNVPSEGLEEIGRHGDADLLGAVLGDKDKEAIAAVIDKFADVHLAGIGGRDDRLLHGQSFRCDSEGDPNASASIPSPGTPHDFTAPDAEPAGRTAGAGPARSAPAQHHQGEAA